MVFIDHSAPNLSRNIRAKAAYVISYGLHSPLLAHCNYLESRMSQKLLLQLTPLDASTKALKIDSYADNRLVSIHDYFITTLILLFKQLFLTPTTNLDTNTDATDSKSLSIGLFDLNKTYSNSDLLVLFNNQHFQMFPFIFDFLNLVYWKCSLISVVKQMNSQHDAAIDEKLITDNWKDAGKLM